MSSPQLRKLQSVLRPQPFHAGRLLLIQDDPQSGASLQRVLQSENIQTDIAPNPEAALSLLEALDYDLIICDLQSPGVTGSELYQCLRRQHPELAERFILTSRDAPSAVSELLGPGPKPELLEKPIELSTLLQTVTRRLGQLRLASANDSSRKAPAK